MNSTPALKPRSFTKITTTDRVSYWVSRNWLLLFSLTFGLYVGLPFLAPVMMKIGWEGPGKVIYSVYSFLCHQLPQRSFFFFGPKGMYSLTELQAAGQNTTNIMLLRQFIGNADMGWKVAWSDRMVSMYTSIPVFALLWWPLRKKVKALPFWGFVLFLLPMAVDGGAHFISDFAGIGLGFRDTNLWLATLTNNAFAPAFYAGDALGSFNSWMRFLTGVFFGLGMVWFLFPYLEEMFVNSVRGFELKLKLSLTTIDDQLSEIFNTKINTN